MIAGVATLDLAVLALLLALAVAGAVTGLLRQLAGLVSVAAGWAAARWLAPLLAGPLLGGQPQPWARALLAAGCFVAALVAVRLVAWMVAKGLHGAGGGLGALDRALGALLGGLKGALVAWVLLSALALVRRPVELLGWRVDVRSSDFGSLAARHNLLEAAPREAERLLGR